MVGITFNRYSHRAGVRNIETSVTYGPFDWIEVEVPVIIAEAQDGEKRFDQLAVLYTPVGNYHWKTADNQIWHDFVVSTWTAENSTNLPKTR